MAWNQVHDRDPPTKIPTRNADEKRFRDKKILFVFSLRRQNEDLRAKLSLFEGSNVVPNEVVEAEASKLKSMHEKECRELRLTIKSLVRLKTATYRLKP